MTKIEKSGRSPGPTGRSNSGGNTVSASILGRREAHKMSVVAGIRMPRQPAANPSELKEDDFEVRRNHLEEKYRGI